MASRWFLQENRGSIFLGIVILRKKSSQLACRAKWGGVNSRSVVEGRILQRIRK